MTYSVLHLTKANSLILFLADVGLDVHETSNCSLFLEICSPKRIENTSAIHEMNNIIYILKYSNFIIFF